MFRKKNTDKEIEIQGVPKEMQKVMVKGLAHDEKSLRESGIVSGSKVMVIGSTFDDVLSLSHQTPQVYPEILNL